MIKSILTAVALTSCALGASAQKATPQLNNIADSLAYYIGDTEGAYTLTTSNSKGENAAAYREAYSKAINYVFSIPLDDTEYFDALKRAVEMRTMVQGLNKEGLDFNLELFRSAFNNAIAGPAQPIDSLSKQAKIVNTLMNNAAKKLQAQKKAEQEAMISTNKAKGEAYVAGLKKKDKKIKTTESGLSYKMVKNGKGTAPKATDNVKVHYTGKLIDGTVFDSSVERGEPATFGVNHLIKGFTEGLMLMQPGGKCTFYIPSDLGYGDMGSGDKIGPGATLIFDVELLEVLPEEETK